MIILGSVLILRNKADILDVLQRLLKVNDYVGNLAGRWPQAQHFVAHVLLEHFALQLLKATFERLNLLAGGDHVGSRRCLEGLHQLVGSLHHQIHLFEGLLDELVLFDEDVELGIELLFKLRVNGPLSIVQGCPQVPEALRDLLLLVFFDLDDVGIDFVKLLVEVLVDVVLGVYLLAYFD